MKDASPDHEERLRDFFARHGGPGQPPQEGEDETGQKGWSEAYARDGHVLRCEWSTMGFRAEMSYTERGP